MRLYKILLLLLFCCILSVNVSCSYENISEKLFTLFTYESNIDVEFENDADIQTFEKRLEALNITIQSTEKKGRALNYILYSNYRLTENDWLATATEFNAEIIDSDANTMLTPKDVRKVEFNGVCLNIYVDEMFYERYDTVAIYHSNIKLEGITYAVWPYIRDENEKYIEYNETPETLKTVLFKSAIAFIPYSFVGNVYITVNETGKPI